MNRARQAKAPIAEAIMRVRDGRIVPFDVPGHKRGRGNPELVDFLGAAVGLDFNSMEPLDFPAHPISIIKEAEDIAAEAFSANAAFFLVQGTSSGVLTMILATVKRGEKIIMPRNVHKSALSALVLCGGQPIYVDPQTHEELGISLGMRIDDIRKAIIDNPDAVAVFLNNPTYYGICSNLREIVNLAHAHGMRVLVDEAHGTHFYFGENLPQNAMAAGADMAALSMHKSGGSLTQSSFLIMGDKIDPEYVRQALNLMQTTSASYLLLASLDISRKNLAINGKEILRNVSDYAAYARAEINKIGGYYAFAGEICDGDAVFDFDNTKLAVNTLGLGLAGVEVYDILRDEYDIQIEFGDIGNFLAYISVGDSTANIERLCSALSEVNRIYRRDPAGMLRYEYINPIVRALPAEAFYAIKRAVPLERAIGMISGECIMCYPPGVPIVAPGEELTRDIVDYIRYAKEKGSRLTGSLDPEMATIQVL